MFKWLRDKMLTGSEGEFNKCIDMCHTFIKFAEKQESNCERREQLDENVEGHVLVDRVIRLSWGWCSCGLWYDFWCWFFLLGA